MRKGYAHPPLVIQATNTIGDVVLSEGQSDFADGLTIFVPSDLENGPALLEVTPDGQNWFVLQSGGTDIAFAAGRAVPILFQNWQGMRLTTPGGPQTVQRTIAVRAYEQYR